MVRAVCFFWLPPPHVFRVFVHASFQRKGTHAQHARLEHQHFAVVVHGDHGHMIISGERDRTDDSRVRHAALE